MKANKLLLLILTLVLALTACSQSSEDSNEESPSTQSSPYIEGDDNANAKQVLSARFNFSPIDPEEIEYGDGLPFVRSQLNFFFTEDATVKEVNDLLVKYNATIEASMSDARILLVKIPDPGSVEAFELLRDQFGAESIVTDVFRVHLPARPQSLPYGFDTNIDSHYALLDHHLSLGFHAAWNAKAASGQPSVLIYDYFGSGYVDAEIVPGYIVNPDNFALTTHDDHGYHVLGILGLSHENIPLQPVGGALPVPFTLDIVDMQGDTNDPELRGTAIGYDMMALERASALAGFDTVIMNLSLYSDCRQEGDRRLKRVCEVEDIREHSIYWIKSVREKDLEDRALMVTIAGNVIDSDPLTVVTNATSAYAYASLATDFVDDDGVPVPPLTNTLVVENASQLPNEQAGCVSPGSLQFDGAIAGIGDAVYSIIDPDTNFENFNGTSMAAPQVAGLAAYISGIRSDYTPQQIISVIKDHTRLTEAASDGPLCAETKVATLIQAYESILALDEGVVAPNEGALEQATPVRFALMDVTNANRESEPDNRFDRHDLADFFDVFESAETENPNGIRNYSRFDLNGDRYLGGEELRQPFDLNANGQIGDVVNAGDATVNFQFNENNVNDWEIFCYYAFSDLYQDSAESLQNYHDDFNELCGTVGDGKIYYQVGNSSGYVAAYDFENTTSYRVSSVLTAHALHPKKFLNSDTIFYTGRALVGQDLVTGIYYQQGIGAEPFLIAADAWNFSVSAGNDKIVYEVADTLFMSNLDGTDVEQLTSDNEVNDYPALSPDGRWLAYAQFNDIGDQSQLSLMNLETGETTHGLSLNASGAVYQPSWSWDSQFIAYELEDSIQILDVANGTVSTLNTETGYRSNPTWSPAGDRIAFSYLGDIYTVNLDGSERTLVLGDPDVGEFRPFWSN